MIYAVQRNANRNQSTVDYTRANIFLYGNRYQECNLVNNTGQTLPAQDGILVVRNSGTFETASAAFGSGLTAGQTMILGGLTFTSTAVTTPSQLALAFSNLQAGATTGAGLATGTYSGTLTGWSTGSVLPTNTVVFTATSVGNVANLAATGTGTAPTITTVAGTAGTQDGVSPATSANLADVIGILKIEGVNDMANTSVLHANYCIKGDIDTTLLYLPIGVNLSTVVGTKALKDILTDLGFVLRNATELTNYGN